MADREKGAALVYCRVSTPGQERDGTSLDSQEASCRAYAEQHGYTVGRVTREVGSGLELWDRQLLSRDREALKRHEFAALIVHDLDRLARNPIHQALIIEECTRADVAVEIVLAPLDTSPEGMLIAYVRGYAAQMEAEKIRERQLRGKRQRALSGRLHGSGTELYGYRRDHAAGVRRIFEPEASVVRRIFELVASEHMSVRAVMRLLNSEGVPPPSADKLTYPDPTRQPHWGVSQLTWMLRHPAYKGVSIAWRVQSTQKGKRPAMRDQSEWIALPDGLTPAIVSPDLWQAAQDAIRSHLSGVTRRNERRFYLLRGLCWCAICGRRLETGSEIEPRKNGSVWRNRTYRCPSRHTPAGNCGAKRINAAWVEEAAWAKTRELLLAYDAHEKTNGRQRRASAPTSTARADDTLTRDLASAEREVARIEGRQADLLRRYTASVEVATDAASAFPWELVEREVARLERDKRQWRATVVELERRLSERRATAAQRAEMRAYIASLRPTLDQLATEEQRVVLESLLARVTVSGKTGTIWLALPADDADDADEGGADTAAEAATENTEDAPVGVLANLC